MKQIEPERGTGVMPWARVARTVCRILVAATALSAFGCSAVIERQRMPNLHARVHSSQRDAIIVKDDGGRLFRIPATSVRDVDHPGNVLATVGAGIVAMGLAMVVGGGVDNGWNSESVYIGAGYGGLGVALITAGLVPYILSRRAAARLHPESLPTRPEADDLHPIRGTTGKPFHTANGRRPPTLPTVPPAFIVSPAEYCVASDPSITGAVHSPLVRRK